MEKLYFIINPKAKNGHSLKVWHLVEKEIRKSNIPYMPLFTEYPGHATEMIDSISNSAKAIIVIGGDGTVHEVVDGLVKEEKIPIGFIPAGSGNDFRRGFHIPKDPLAALHFLLSQNHSKPTYVDIGEIVQTYDKKTRFINNMGVGFDAVITKEANQSGLKSILNKFSLGNLIYAYFVIKHIFTFKCSKVTVNINGEDHHFDNTWFVTVSNQPYYGGGMKISPQASVTDGLLNITVVHHLSRLKFLFVFITVFWGGHTRFKEVENFIGKNITIESNTPMLVHADGEYIGETPVGIQAFKQKLPLLTKEIEKRGT